ncbi:chorismate-binding protein [Limnobacter sp.]|uniref:chorismate-binding protein n=1 Tax=Limnobacter sp. TaxID=2003368 RepID=UPI003518E563
MECSQVTAAWHASMASDGSDAHGLRVAMGEPLHAVQAMALAEVKAAVQQASDWAMQGLWVVGAVAYEAAPAFDPSLVTRTVAGHAPLAYFAAYRPSQIHNLPLLQQAESQAQAFEPWLDSMPLQDYLERFADIRAAIESGEFYQINFTTRLQAKSSSLDPWPLFLHFFNTQPAQQSLFLRMPGQVVLSWSPELFFELNGRALKTSPMKGTRPRQRQLPMSALSDSSKDRAENVMIVDLLRNDMAKVCVPKSVQVASLFDVMHLPTVEQMTSTIIGTLRPGLALVDVFEALFPCGSVTGAPKSQAMKRIAQWEPAPRGVYCGAAGVISPSGVAQFNVPIRTAVFQSDKDHLPTLTYGVGSGITWYSHPLDEKREWWQKTAFLRQASIDFQVLETVLLCEGQWQHLDLHIARMARAADFFSYVWDESAIRRALKQHASAWPKGRHRSRWLLHAEGHLAVDVQPLPSPLGPVNLQLASAPMIAPPAFVLHKTTLRGHYDRWSPTEADVFDTVLYSQNGALTETCRCNLVLQLDGGLLTPALEENDGVVLLPGVMREVLLRENTLQTARLTVQDFRRAEAVWLINSLRGWLPVAQVRGPQGEIVFQSKP